MFKKNFYIHFRIINYWFSFLFLLTVVSNLPHQPAPTFTWVNSSFYFLLFLQCWYLFRRELQNKFIYLNLCFFALFHSLSFIYLLMGDHEFIGNDYLAYYFYEYLNIIEDFSFAFCIIFIAVKYFLKDSKTISIYLLSLSIILPIFLWHYYPFLLDKQYILNIEDIVFDKTILSFTFLPLFFLLLYGIILYKYDRSLGEHINTIMVCFFVMTIMDITNLVGNVYQITKFTFTQYILLVTLSFFLITMFRLLNHAYSAFGKFYDSLMVEGKNLGVPIKRKKSATAPLLDFVKAYFHQRRNTIGFSALLSIFLINYSPVPIFVKLNLAAICFGLLVLFFYLSALYQKRLKKGDLLT